MGEAVGKAKAFGRILIEKRFKHAVSKGRDEMRCVHLKSIVCEIKRCEHEFSLPRLIWAFENEK